MGISIVKQGYLLAAVALLLVLSGVSLFVGVRNLTIWGLLSGEAAQAQVLVVSRIPRLVAIITAGMSMSVVGLIMQQLARNKFVSPSTAGTTESASLGILVATLLFPAASLLQKMTIAFGFALVGTTIFMKMLERAKYKDVIFVPLIGIMFGGVIGSITTFFAYRFDLLQSLNSWMNGDFSGILRGRYELLYLAVPVTILAYIYADRFTLAGMGESFAVNLGLNYQQVMNIGLVIIALSTSVVTLTVGSIPFLGLIVPNVVTILMGDNIKKTLPHTALWGALFVLICDILGRTVRYPYEIPVSLIVGVIGSAIFLYLILRRGVYAPQS
jgi:iron complex transport system permease protein